MKKLNKLTALIIVFTMLITVAPHYTMFPSAENVSLQVDETGSGAVPQNIETGSWMEEISHNSAYAGIISVPPVIRVANSGYGLDDQSLSASDCSTIQTQVINYSTRSMQSYSTSISITLPEGASAPTLTITTQGAASITIVADNTSGNPYTWHISGGLAIAGNYIDYRFSYNLNGRQYIQKAASYIDYVELAAGWQNYVVRRNFSDVTHTRHEYTAVLSGSCSSGSGYAVYGNGGTGYYKMSTGGGSTAFVTGAGGIYSGMKLWDPGYDNRENCSVWYCGQPGKDSSNNDNVDGGYRANLDVYYDPAIVSNISQLGIKLLYWRSTSPAQMATMYQEKMIYLLGNPLFSGTDSSNSTAQSYFYSTNALNNSTQNISTNPGTMVFSFAGTALPADGQKVTFGSAIYGNYEQKVYLTTWDAWLITFHVVQKSALRALLNTEDTAFRQIHDGYTDTDGSFTAYLAQLAKSKSVLNQPNASAVQIAAAVSDLTAAINNLKYVPADYTALSTLVDNIYSDSFGYRPSIVNDPDYYLAGTVFYPAAYYQSTSELAAAIASIEKNHDIRYQAYINSMVTGINSIWRAIVLKNSDYTTVNYYLNMISGLNDLTGSPAGNYVMANGTNYPQYLNQMIYWKNFTETSYTNWETAVNGVTLGLKIPDQTAVANMGSALQSAFNGLIIKPADYTALNAVRDNVLAAINNKIFVQNPEGEGHFYNYYSTASIDAMQAKLSSITDGLLMPEQATVYIWTDDLQTIYNGRSINNADYTYANAQQAIPAMYEANYTHYYTADSWQVLVNARNSVQNGKFADEQAAVNTWAQNICNARNALVFYPADYSEVSVAVTAANELTASNYQNWSAVQTAINAVVYGLNIASQATVDAYATGINAAISNLIPVNAEMGNLISALTSTLVLNENMYTPESWITLSNAVAAGILIRDAVPAYNYTQQAEVEAAALTINNAITNLIYIDADYSGVSAAITAANALTPADYKNWSTVQTAMDSVTYWLNITHQTAVDDYAAAINSAINGLVFIDADLTALTTAFSNASAFNESLYTPESWAVLANAVAAGIAIRDAIPAYSIVRQNDVDVAVLAVNTAIDNLIFSDADISILITALSGAGNYIESLYTHESWLVFNNAVAAGTAIRDALPAYNITRQGEVDSAVLSINNTAAGLVEATVEFIPSQLSTTVVDFEKGYIYGLTADGSLQDLVAQGFIELVGNGHLVYTPTALGFGTGTKVELVRDADSKIMAVYYIVIFGDTDGDGFTDGNDACLASMISAGMLTENDLSKAAYYAADANHDGVINNLDTHLLEQAGLFIVEIRQTAI